MMIYKNRGYVTLMATIMLVVCFGQCGVSRAQSNVALLESRYPRRVQWAAYDPFYAVTSRVYAQAELIRAQGDAAVSFGYARNLNAEAYSEKLDNWEKELRKYWNRKVDTEKRKLELDQVRKIKKMMYLNDRKWRHSHAWDRLKNHPELNKARIEKGKALNFLLARLSVSALPYRFNPESSRFGQDAIRELSLDQTMLGHVMLKQGVFKFPADQSVQDSISLWPYLLRWDEFDSTRSAFERARAAIVDGTGSGGDVPVAEIRHLHEALMRLSHEFHQSLEVKQWVDKHRRYSHFVTADRFLQELDREILRLEETGDIHPFRGGNNYDPEVAGDNLISLLCFMNRNGLEFAPAQPGNESAYHHLFVMMRSLYLTVAEQDPSTQPKNLSEMAG